MSFDTRIFRYRGHKASLSLILPDFAALFAQDLNRAAIPTTLKTLTQKAHFEPDSASLSKHLVQLFAPHTNWAGDLPVAKLRKNSATAICADPCYLHPDRDRLLVFHQGLDLTQQEAQTIAEAVQPLLEKFSAKLIVQTPQHWLLELADMPAVTFTALSELNGQPVADHLPKGKQAADWICLSNEIQMLLFDLPLNQQREAAGKLPVNSLWFWGAAPLPDNWQHWQTVSGQHVFLDKLCQLSGSTYQPASDSLDALLNDRGGIKLHVMETLNWQSDWQRQLEQMEQDWFKPAWQLLRSWKIKRLNVIVPEWGQYNLSSLDSWSFWK